MRRDFRLHILKAGFNTAATAATALRWSRLPASQSRDGQHLQELFPERYGHEEAIVTVHKLYNFIQELVPKFLTLPSLGSHGRHGS